jgi:signal transduction histidine kinase
MGRRNTSQADDRGIGEFVPRLKYITNRYKELKAQQESFIDTISHEMRNPLSAILQSIDEIADYLSQQNTSTFTYTTSARSSIEAVETIMLCCQHQRRVIDDVLTLSKMNADMLFVALDNVDPLEVVNSAIKIFAGDTKIQGIVFSVDVEKSIRQMSVNRLLFDLSRLPQVLVNLLGNAIKFTRDSSERRITVSVGVFASKPPSSDHEVDYFEPQLHSKTKSAFEANITGEELYLRIAVQDTGIGMTSKKERLFKRFS